MSGIEDLINSSVRDGMQMATQAFAEGGEVQGYALGGLTEFRDFEDWYGWDEPVTPTAPAPALNATTQPVASAPVTYSDPASGGVSWTNINGYQIPVYDASVFGGYEVPIFGTYDFGDGSNYGQIGSTPGWGLSPSQVYGGNLYGEGSPYNYWANWSLAPQGAGFGETDNTGFNLDPSGFDGMLKVGDKEGLRVRYTLQDGKYVPTLVGTQPWNTNYDNTGELMTALMVAGGVGAYLAGPAAAAGTSSGMAAGEGAMIGSGLTSAADLAVGAGAGATAAGAGGMTAAELAAAYGPAVGEPIATSGFTAAQGGIGSLGSGWGTAGVVAGEGGAATLGSTAASLAGTLPSGVVDAVNTAVNTGMPLEEALAWNGLNYTPTEWAQMTGSPTPAAPVEETPNWPQDGPGDPAVSPPNAPSSTLPGGNLIPYYGQRLLDWAIAHPEAVLTLGSMAGAALENPDSPSGGGGGGSGGGWNGPLTQYAAGRAYTPAPEGYRPGFSPEHQYVSYMIDPMQAANQPPTTGPGADIPPLPPTFAQGGIARLDPRMVKGPGDGMSDSIPATIDGRQRAALSTDEFVIPADVVSHIGNGSSEAGAQELHRMMDRIRQARTGNPEQARQINPRSLLPK